MWGTTSVQWGITSVLWRVFSTVGIPSVQWGDNISTVEVAQYSGDKDFEILRIFKESRNLFQSLFHFEIRSATSQDSIADHG